MKTKIIAFLTAILLLALSGCNNTPSKEDKPQPFSFSESNQTSAKSKTPAAKENTEVETTPESVQNLTPSKKQKELAEKDSVNTGQSQDIPDSEQITHHAELPKKADTTEITIPKQKPSEPERTESKKPEPEVTSPPITKPPTTEETSSKTEPTFDIGYWISFAKSYAKSIGLELDSEAIYCWDNPLGAGSHSKYLERDITSCLNRYAKDKDITAVWVWAESTGDNTFNLYIGYA